MHLLENEIGVFIEVVLDIISITNITVNSHRRIVAVISRLVEDNIW